MKRLGQSAVTTGAGTLIYTVPTGYKTSVMNIDIANTNGTSNTFALHLVASGGSATAANTLVPTVSVDGHTMIQWSGNQMLSAGDFIQAIGGSSGMTVTVSGEESRVSI